MRTSILLFGLFGVAFGNPILKENSNNAEELSGKFEGDIVLTATQEKQLFGLERTGLINTMYRWPNNTVPYEISTDFDQDQFDYIELGLRRIEEVTCLRFVRRTNEVNYVYVIGEDDGCWSYVGHLNGGMQELNLQRYAPGVGCFRIGTIIHEFLHTLGFYHMQSATERDDYVTIKWEHIQPGTENNFNTYGADRITNFGVDYDVSSVMHYGAYGFSKNGFATIVPHDITLINTMGQRTGLTDKDVTRINRMYDCDML